MIIDDYDFGFKQIAAFDDAQLRQYLLETYDFVDLRTPEQVRQDIRTASPAELLDMAREEDCDHPDELGCSCGERLRKRLLSMEDDEISGWMGLTSLQEERALVENFRCLDCSQFTDEEYYMVHNMIWNLVHPDRDGILCIGCLEARLGRLLTHHDFMKVPVNTLGSKTERLTNRLNRD